MISDILQPTHLLFVLVVALLVLGPKRLPEAGRALGKGLRDFRSAISGEEEKHDEIPSEAAPAPPPEAAVPPAATAPMPPQQAAFPHTAPDPASSQGTLVPPVASAPIPSHEAASEEPAETAHPVG